MISQSCKITSTNFHILLQLSKQCEEKVFLIVCITYFVWGPGKLRHVDCGAPDNWSLSVQNLSVTGYSRSHVNLRNFLSPGSQHSFSGSSLYQLLTCELISCSHCLSHLEVCLGQLHPLNQIIFSPQHHFRCKHRVLVCKVSPNPAPSFSEQTLKVIFILMLYIYTPVSAQLQRKIVKHLVSNFEVVFSYITLGWIFLEFPR